MKRLRSLWRTSFKPSFVRASYTASAEDAATVSARDEKALSAETSTAFFETSSREVKFADEREIVAVDSECFLDDLEQQWWTAEDISDFKASYREQVRVILQEESHNETRDSSIAVLERVYLSDRDSLILQPNDLELFEHYVQGNEGRYGLEKTLNRLLATDKHVRRAKLAAILRSIQQACDGELTEYYSDMIRRACEEITKPCCVYAHRLALVYANSS